jgi:adenine-specific DNA-methyltransferase
VGNISKQRRDDLVAKIKAIRTFVAGVAQDENAVNLLTYLSEIEKDVKAKKYGLVYEEHREAVDELLDTHIPILIEEEDLFVYNGGQINFLIEGDNLAALHLLEKTHRGRIDVIYIDPPYNRGKTDFVYDDNFVDTTDTFRHSKWISFMRARLEIAKRLLAKGALIFISIDDNEDATLKLICDDVFSPECFINKFVWQRNSSGKTEKDKFTINTEYVLLYAKSKPYTLYPAYKPLAESSRKLYKNDDHDGRGLYQTVSLQKPRDPGPETTYDYVDESGKAWKCPPKGWRMTFEKVKALELDGRLVMSGKTLRVKDYWNERENEGKRVDTLWNDLSENNVGTTELETILGKSGMFDNPKPTDLIMRCLQIAGKSSVVLDFFVGSGTTGQAVLKQNASDGGNRQFIIVTNNENDICRQVTYPRVSNVIRQNEYKASLKYYRIDFVPIAERLYYEYADELLLHIRELVELENGINFYGNAEIAIVLTDDEMTGFVDNIDNFNKCRKLYIGHNVLPTGKQQNALKRAHIEVNVIPNYYYSELEV